MTQATPLRIRAIIERHLSPAEANDIETIRQMKRAEDLRNVEEKEMSYSMEDLAIPSDTASTKKVVVSSNIDGHSQEENVPTAQQATENFRVALQKLPSDSEEFNYEEKQARIIAKRRERIHASKTLRKSGRRYKVFLLIYKLFSTKLLLDSRIQSLKAEEEEEITYSLPTTVKTFGESTAQEFGTTNKQRTVIRLDRSSKGLKMSKLMKITTSSPTTASPTLPLRQHCLNIRSFSRQFGMTDVNEFATDTRVHQQTDTQMIPSGDSRSCVELWKSKDMHRTVPSQAGTKMFLTCLLTVHYFLRNIEMSALSPASLSEDGDFGSRRISSHPVSDHTRSCKFRLLNIRGTLSIAYY
uniref:aECM cysteine-cradle domain-containing protein n=1 Tax=Heterorhabditis bacteriophora TaxID=37862 RepID=A0A1I7WMA8_HETBA